MVCTAVFGVRIIRAPMAKKRILIPPDAIFTFFARSLSHRQTDLTSPQRFLTLLTRKPGISVSAPSRGCHRRSPRRPKERTEIGSPGMPQAFYSQPRTLACCRPGVRTEYMDFSARPSNASFALGRGYAMEYKRRLYPATRFTKAMAHVTKGIASTTTS